MDNLNYTLAAEDVVVLPSMNAQGLVKRGAAYPINQE
jgi:DNA replication factor GINS